MDVHWLMTLLLMTERMIAASYYTLPFCMSVCFICAHVFVAVSLFLSWMEVILLPKLMLSLIE